MSRSAAIRSCSYRAQRSSAVDGARRSPSSPAPSTTCQTEVPVGPTEGLQGDSVIDCEDLYTVTIDQLAQYLGVLEQPAMQAVDAGLRVALDLT